MSTPQQQMITLFAQYTMLMDQDFDDEWHSSESSSDESESDYRPRKARSPNRDRKRMLYSKLLLNDY